MLSSEWFDDFLARKGGGVLYEKDCEAWEPHYQRAIEYPASRIFIALRDSMLHAKGRLMPATDLEEEVLAVGKEHLAA